MGGDPASESFRAEVKERICSTVLKTRLDGFTELKQLFKDFKSSGLSDTAVFDMFASEIPNLINDSNAMAQSKLAEALVAFVDAYPVFKQNQPEYNRKNEVLMNLYNACSSTMIGKISISPKAFESVYEFVATIIEQVGHMAIRDKRNVESIVEGLLAVLTEKLQDAGQKVSAIKGTNIKVVVSALSIIRKAILEFGKLGNTFRKIINVVIKLQEMTDKAFRENFYGLLVEVVNYSRSEEFTNSIMNELSSQQQKQLSRELSGLENKPPPQPTRQFRISSEDVQMTSPKDVEDDKSVTKNDLFDEVDVFKEVCTKAWEKEITEGAMSSDDQGSDDAAWKIKQRAAMLLHDKLKANPIVKPNPYISTVAKILQRIWLREGAIPVLVAGLRLCGMIAQRLEKEFIPHCAKIAPQLISRVRDPNKQVSAAATEAAEYCLLYCSYEAFHEDMIKLLSERSASVRQTGFDLYKKVYDTAFQAFIMPRYSPALLECAKRGIEDSSANVRSSASAMLISMGKLLGLDAIRKTLSSLPMTKQKPILDVFASSSGGSASRLDSTAAAGKDTPASKDKRDPKGGDKKNGKPFETQQLPASNFKGVNEDELEVSALKLDSIDATIKDLLPPSLYTLLSSVAPLKRKDGLMILRVWWDENRAVASQHTEAFLIFLRAKNNDFKERAGSTTGELLLFLRELMFLSSKYTRLCACLAAIPWIERMGEPKYTAAITEFIMDHLMIFPATFVCRMIIKGAEDSKSPKVSTWSLGLLEKIGWDEGCRTTGVHKHLILFAKSLLESKTKTVKEAAAHLIAHSSFAVGDKFVSKMLESSTTEIKALLKTAHDSVAALTKGEFVSAHLEVAMWSSTGKLIIESLRNDTNSMREGIVLDAIKSDLIEKLRGTQASKRSEAIKSAMETFKSHAKDKIRPEGLADFVGGIKRSFAVNTGRSIGNVLELIGAFMDLMKENGRAYVKLLIPAVLDKYTEFDETNRELSRSIISKCLEYALPDVWYHAIYHWILENSTSEMKEHFWSIIASDKFILDSDYMCNRVLLRSLYEQLDKFKVDKLPLLESLKKVLQCTTGRDVLIVTMDATKQQRETFFSIIQEAQPQMILYKDVTTLVKAKLHEDTKQTSKSVDAKASSSDARDTGKDAVQHSATQNAGDSFVIFNKSSRAAYADMSNSHFPIEVSDDLIERVKDEVGSCVSYALLDAMFEDAKPAKKIKGFKFWFSILNNTDGSISADSANISEDAQIVRMLLKWIALNVMVGSSTFAKSAMELLVTFLPYLEKHNYILSDAEASLFLPHVFNAAGNEWMSKESFDSFISVALPTLPSAAAHNALINCLKIFEGKLKILSVLNALMGLQNLKKQGFDELLYSSRSEFVSICKNEQMSDEIKELAVMLIEGLYENDLRDIFQDNVIPSDMRLYIHDRRFMHAKTKNVISQSQKWYQDWHNETEAAISEFDNSKINESLAKFDQGITAVIDEFQNQFDKFIAFTNNLDEDTITRQAFFTESVPNRIFEENELARYEHDIIERVCRIRLKTFRSNFAVNSINSLQFQRWCYMLRSQDADSLYQASTRIFVTMKTTDSALGGETFCNCFITLMIDSIVIALNTIFQERNFRSDKLSDRFLRAGMCTLVCLESCLKLKGDTFFVDYIRCKNLCKVLLVSMRAVVTFILKNKFVTKNENNMSMKAVVVNVLNLCFAKLITSSDAHIRIFVFTAICELCCEYAEGAIPELADGKNEHLVWKSMEKLHRKLQASMAKVAFNSETIIRYIHTLITAWKRANLSYITGLIPNNSTGLVTLDRLYACLKLFLYDFAIRRPEELWAYLQAHELFSGLLSAKFAAFWDASAEMHGMTTPNADKLNANRISFEELGNKYDTDSREELQNHPLPPFVNPTFAVLNGKYKKEFIASAKIVFEKGISCGVINADRGVSTNLSAAAKDAQLLSLLTSVVSLNKSKFSDSTFNERKNLSETFSTKNMLKRYGIANSQKDNSSAGDDRAELGSATSKNENEDLMASHGGKGEINEDIIMKGESHGNLGTMEQEKMERTMPRETKYISQEDIKILHRQIDIKSPPPVQPKAELLQTAALAKLTEEIDVDMDTPPIHEVVRSYEMKQPKAAAPISPRSSASSHTSESPWKNRRSANAENSAVASNAKHDPDKRGSILSNGTSQRYAKLEDMSDRSSETSVSSAGAYRNAATSKAMGTSPTRNILGSGSSKIQSYGKADTPNNEKDSLWPVHSKRGKGEFVPTPQASRSRAGDRHQSANPVRRSVTGDNRVLENPLQSLHNKNKVPRVGTALGLYGQHSPKAQNGDRNGTPRVERRKSSIQSGLRSPVTP